MARTGWTEMFVTRANVRNLRGGETVQASRMAGKQPVVLTIRRQEAAAEVSNDWRARDTRSGVVYNITAIVSTDDRKFYEITAISGVPA